jgi:iron complex transport system substrate-binding protein
MMSLGAVESWRIGAVLLVLLCSPLLASKAPRLQDSSAARIISLVPSVTEMLFAMGAGDRVVGVSNFDHYPPEVERRTKVGGLLDPDFERILSLRPDLVIVYGTQSGLLERLGRARIPVFHYQHAALADITETMRKIGDRIGRRDAAATLASSIERQIADIRRKSSGLKRPRTMIVFEREPGSLRGMYEAAGGADVFADLPRQSLQITSEIALARAPEVIIEVHSGPEWTPALIAREREVWKALPSVPAVRSGSIYILADEVMSIPGPRVPQAILALAKLLHPEVFK